MPDDFQFAVFLRHSAKDKPVLGGEGERLKKDGLMPAVEGKRRKFRFILQTSCIAFALPRARVLHAGEFENVK